MVSIRNFGVVRHDGFGGDVGATVLVDDENEFRWLVGHGGQHRAPVISAMGHKNITIRVWQVVERKDVAIWPNVQSGLFTEASALKVFDRIFIHPLALREQLELVSILTSRSSSTHLPQC